MSGTRTCTFAGRPVAERVTEPGSTTSKVQWLDSDLVNTATIAQNSSTGAVIRCHCDPFGNSRDPAVVTWPSNHGFLNKPTSDLAALTISAPANMTQSLGGSRPSIRFSTRVIRSSSTGTVTPTTVPSLTATRPACWSARGQTESTANIMDTVARGQKPQRSAGSGRGTGGRLPQQLVQLAVPTSWVSQEEGLATQTASTAQTRPANVLLEVLRPSNIRVCRELLHHRGVLVRSRQLRLRSIRPS